MIKYSVIIHLRKLSNNYNLSALLCGKCSYVLTLDSKRTVLMITTAEKLEAFLKKLEQLKILIEEYSKKKQFLNNLKI